MEVVEIRGGLENAGPSVVTVGVFDGVHIGHQSIMRRTVNEARERHLRSVAITFDRNPEEVIRPSRHLACITTLSQKLRLIDLQQIDLALVLPLSRQVLEMSAEEFVTEILHGKLGAAMVVMGSDFALGKDRRGDAGFLRAMGADLGFQVEIVPPVLLGNGVVSSTAIRAAVAAGDLDRANAMLGHPFALQGLVVAGDGVGREIGFPTANIKPAECQVLPLGGVYSVCVEIAGETWLGVANIGTRPTLGGNRVSIEVFVIDFKGDLYGQELEVVFQHRLRDEVRFASLDELKSQIARDVEKARASGGCSVLP